MLRSARKNHWAFTLVELLVVIAIIALLISILLPSLARAREQAKRMRCLGNMKDIGVASNTYALDDTTNVLVPVPAKRTVNSWFWGNELFGGKGGNPDLIEAQQWKHAWTAFRRFGPGDRPLNRIFAKNPTWISWDEANDSDDPYDEDDPRIRDHAKLDLDVFKCPSDVGLVAGTGVLNPGWADAFNTAGVPADTPLYDVTGNSYATHWMTPLISMGNPPPYYGWGAVQRQVEDVPRPSRCIIYREGNARDAEWFNTLYGPWTSSSQALKIKGWHGEEMEFNATFGDGHASQISHLIRTDVTSISPGGYRANHTGNFVLRGCRMETVTLPFGGPVFEPFLMRGDGWQMDFFPNPLTVVIADESQY